MADDWISRGPRLRAEMLALLRRPYEPHHIPRPSDADLEAFADAFVASSRPYHERERKRAHTPDLFE